MYVFLVIEITQLDKINQQTTKIFSEKKYGHIEEDALVRFWVFSNTIIVMEGISSPPQTAQI